MSPRHDDRGFTLPELLVAITILGIIMGVIGLMIVTAFRTTATVSSQLNASRGPKVVSRYWVPDVESADAVTVGDGACPSTAGGTAVVTFAWNVEPATVDTPDVDVDTAPGVPRTVTWWTVDGARQHLIRTVCDNGVVTDTTTIVSDLDGAPNVDEPAPGRHVYTIDVTVPDESGHDNTFDFSVAARQQVTS